MKIVSQKIRNSAKDECCTLRVSPECNDYTVVFCHLNSPFKGTSLKSPDLFGVYGCYPCHQLLDSGGVDAVDQLRALQETQMRLAVKDLIKVA